MVKQTFLRRVSTDLFLESAYIRQFEIVGEALRVVRKIDPDFHNQLPEIYQWIGFGHDLIYEYREIDLELLWSTAVSATPNLIQQLESLLEK